MDRLLDILAYFDWINRVEGFISTFLNADWKGAYNRRGYIGVVDECFASLLGQNAWTFRVPRDCGWRGIEIERLLKRHGVRIWGRGVNGRELFFQVKLRQADWAEYLLLRCGIPLTSTLFNPRNLEYARWYSPGTEPPMRNRNKTKQRAHKSLIDYIIRLTADDR